jgi:hypothetical protein
MSCSSPTDGGVAMKPTFTLDDSPITSGCSLDSGATADSMQSRASRAAPAKARRAKPSKKLSRSDEWLLPLAMQCC